MKRLIIMYFSIFLFLSTFAQEVELRKVELRGNKVSFKEILHASIYFEINGKVIYVDPWGPDSLYVGLKKADAIMITDIHPDHYSEENIKKVMSENTFFIVPPAIYDMMPEEWKSKCSVLRNNEEISFDDIRLKITAIPMYNVPEKSTQPHIKGRGNGYILNVDDYKIYISGDTGGTPEMLALTDIDMAFICMNFPYTMTVDDAIIAVKAFKPKVVYPYHYRNGDKTFGDIKRFCEMVSHDGIECHALDWY